MLYRDICKILGTYLFGLCAVLTLPLFVGCYYEFFAHDDLHPQPHSTLYFLETILICLSFALILRYIGKDASAKLYRREGLASVVLVWILTPIVASLPYLLSDTFTNPYQAFFEATSGFTTTGATVMQPKQFDPQTGEEVPFVEEVCGIHDTTYTYYGTIEPIRDPQTGAILFEGIDAVSKPLLFWRSFTQWIGGMGVIVLFIAILPALGAGGKLLFQAEVPGPLKGSLTPRIKETALQLWKIYLSISLLEVFLLLITNREMSLFEAITTTFSTVSTGGFTVHSASIGYYNNAYTEWIVLAFMLIGSTNFSLYFYSLRGKFYRIYEPEFLLYLTIVFFACLFVSYSIVGMPKILSTGIPQGIYSLSDSIRYGCFQAISAQTSTGFITADYDLWPFPTQTLLLILMYVGGMSGSTAGGMKVVRHYMLFRIAQFKIESLFRPETVRKFFVGTKEITKSLTITVLCFFFFAIFLSVFGTFLYILDGVDPETSLGLATSMINNVGIAFRKASPTQSCAFLSNFSLCLSSLLMIFGRLEFFAILAIMVPAFWKKNA